MNKLSQLIEKLTEAQKISEVDVSDHNWTTRPGMEMRKKQAQVDFENLTIEYRKAFFERVAKVFVSGTNNRDRFVSLIKSDGAFVCSSNDLYVALAGYVEPLINYGGPFSSGAYIKLVETSAAFARLYGVNPQLIKEPLNCGVADFAGLVSLIKEVVRGSYNDNLNKAYLLETIYAKAIQQKFSKDVALFVLTDLSEQERSVMLDNVLPGNPNFVVDLNDSEVPTRALTTKIYSKVYDTFRKLGRIDSGKKTEPTDVAVPTDTAKTN